MPDIQALVQGANGSEGLNAQFGIPETAAEVIYDRNRGPFAREMQRSFPSAKSIPAQYSNSHLFSSESESINQISQTPETSVPGLCSLGAAEVRTWTSVVTGEASG